MGEAVELLSPRDKEIVVLIAEKLAPEIAPEEQMTKEGFGKILKRIYASQWSKENLYKLGISLHDLRRVCSKIGCGLRYVVVRHPTQIYRFFFPGGELPSRSWPFYSPA